MKDVVTKAFVQPFYKAFLGLFLLVFIILGVFLKAEVHVMLGYQIIQSTYALLALFLFFSFYAFLHWNFQKKLLIKPAYRIFHQLGLSNPKIFYTQQLYVWLGNHALLILYAVFLTVLSIDINIWHTLPKIWGMLFFLYFSYASLIYYQLRRPLSEANIHGKKNIKPNALNTRYPFWLLVHLKENRPLLLLTSKFLSLLILNIFFGSFQSGDYDNRWLQFAILCISFINYPLLLEKKNFETSKLSYFLNMPVSFFEKLKAHFLQIFVIILPEIIFIIYQDFNTEIDFRSLPLILLTIALNIGIYGLCNSVSDHSKMSRNIFISFFLVFFGILYNLPWVVLSLPALILLLTSIKSTYKN